MDSQWENEHSRGAESHRESSFQRGRQSVVPSDLRNDGRKGETLSTGLNKRKVIGNSHKDRSPERDRKKPDDRVVG